MGILADQVGRQITMVLGVRMVPSDSQGFFSVASGFLTSISRSQVIFSGLSVFVQRYDVPHARFIAFVVSYGIVAGGYNALPTIITGI